MAIKDDETQPFHWERKWVEPTPSTVPATLGPRPGNTLRPPPNKYTLHKWTNTERKAEVAFIDPPSNIKFFKLESTLDVGPEIIAGIDISELKTELQAAKEVPN